MTTILGSHISTIRPIPPKRCIVYDNERPYAKYQAKTKTVKTHCGKVRYISVKAAGGGIFSLTKGTHIDVMNTFNLPPEQIIATGWMLENGEWIWR